MHIVGLQAHTKGRNVLLVKDTEVRRLLHDFSQKTPDSDALCLSRAATIIRRNLSDTLYRFEGSFGPECQVNSVPPYLLALVCMILEGPSILQQTESEVTQEALSIAQLLRHNNVRH